MTTLARSHVFVDSDPVYASEVNAELNNILKMLRLRVAHVDGTKGYSTYPTMPGSDPTLDNEPNRKSRVDSQLELAELHFRAASGGVYSSTSYVDFGSAKTFTKTRADTDLVVMVVSTGYSSVINQVVTFGFRVATTDYDVVNKMNNRASVHMPLAGFRAITGIGAGSTTVKARIKVSSGNWTHDGTDILHWYVKEVYPDTT